MLRDNLVGLIEPMLGSAGANPSRSALRRESHRTIDPHALIYRKIKINFGD
jgi:hypothetical protein